MCKRIYSRMKVATIWFLKLKKDCLVTVEMPGTGSTQMEVVFYEDNTPEFHAEQEWENRFRPVYRNVVSEFDHSALCTKGRGYD